MAGKHIVQSPNQLGQFAPAPDERAARRVHGRPGRNLFLLRHQVELRVLGEYRPLELA